MKIKYNPKKIEEIYNAIIDDIPNLDNYDIIMRPDLKKIMLIDNIHHKCEIKSIDSEDLITQIKQQKLIDNPMSNDKHSALQADRNSKLWVDKKYKKAICPSFVKFFLIVFFRTGYILSEVEYGILYNKIYVQKIPDDEIESALKEYESNKLKEEHWLRNRNKLIRYNDNWIDNVLCRFNSKLFDITNMIVNVFSLGELFSKLHKFYPSIIRMFGSMHTFAYKGHKIYYSVSNDYAGNDYIVDDNFAIKDSTFSKSTTITDKGKNRYSKDIVKIINFEEIVKSGKYDDIKYENLEIKKSIRLRAKRKDDFYINYLTNEKYDLLKE